jgi:LAO/AO transport system kinase
MRPGDQSWQGLEASVLSGDRRALARALSAVENEAPEAPTLLAAVYPLTGRAHVIGVTGAPGTGKSTLVNVLARAYRVAGETVGIVAVDPTSPFSGGALLGDRARMRDLAGDPGVFIRSMATRGSLGGLARTAHEVLEVLDAAGFSRILVETVGVGQAEVDIASTAHTTIVIEAPGLGDELQTMKAGVLEIADLLVVNKADREGANQAVTALQMMQGLAFESDQHEVLHFWGETSSKAEGEAEPRTGWPPGSGEAGHQSDGSWLPPILKTVAVSGDGVDVLLGWIEAHRTYLHSTGKLADREIARATSVLEEILCQELKAALRAALPEGQLARLATAVAQREIDPYRAAREILAQHLAVGLAQ